MKKIVALLLTLVSVMLCSTSCTPTPDVPSTAEESNFISSSTTLVYRNLYFSMEKAGNELKYGKTSYTLKYHNLDNVQEEAIPVYNDVFSGDDDPFITNGPSGSFLLDKKATEENNGSPVLIFASSTFAENESRIIRIISFNTATNKMTVIAENIPNFYDDFWLYEDTIYFYCYNPAFEDGGDGFEPYCVSKYGGEITRLEYPDRTFRYELLGVYKNELYFSNRSTKGLYKSNIDFKNPKLLGEDINSPFISNGYLYYKTSNTTQVDGYDLKYYNLHRCTLDSFSLEKSETVLENTVYISSRDNIFYYGLVKDVEIRDLPAWNVISRLPYSQIEYSYNLATGEKETVFNYSNEKRLGISPVFANDNYYIYCYEVPTDEIIMGDPVTELITVVVNRKTGKETVIPDSFSIY